MKQASPFKYLLLLSILLAASLPAFSQHFDWVRTYTGQEVTSGVTTNHLVGSCVDSAGNLYILGEFSPYAELCGERLLPSSVITMPLKHGIVIAKLSSSGELLWHKAIYNDKDHDYAHALRMVGDSAIMVMVRFCLPFDNGYSQYEKKLYYLDTLLTGNDDYLMPTDSVESPVYTAFITFDLDGNAVERHLLCVGYTDTNGNALTWRSTLGSAYTDQLRAEALSWESFNVDSEGNIYVVRQSGDAVYGQYNHSTNDFPWWRIDEGTIGALKIVVDGTQIIYYPIPYPTSTGNQQILKFSPHFDSLIDAVYVFDSTLLHCQTGYSEINSFNIDAQGNLYIAMVGDRMPAHLGIANSNSLHLGDSLLGSTWILKYNPNLYATDLIQLSYIRSDGSGTPQLGVCDIYVDNRTNSLFVSGSFLWSLWDTIFSVFYNEDTLDLPNNSGYWMRLDKDNLRLLSIGRVLPGESGKVIIYPKLDISNNRVFSEIGFLWSIAIDDTAIFANQFSSHDKAFAIWNYDGDLLYIMNHGLNSSNNEFRSPHVIDSIVYLTGSIWEDAQFDTIETHNQGASQVFIAKYVDPAFAQPYKYEQAIEWQQELVFTLTDNPVTLTATATSGLPITYTCNDSSIAYVRGDTLHLVADGYAWLTATQDGDDHYFPAELVQKLLTVSGVGIATVGADGQAKAYPNPTSGRVTLDLAKIPPAPPLPYHKPGPSDSRDVDMVLYTSPGAPFSQFETCPFPYHQRYNMKVSGSPLLSHNGVVTAWLTDMQGRREEVVLTPTGPDQYTLDLTARPPAAYLLTVTTADGRELTFRLVKQYGRR